MDTGLDRSTEPEHVRAWTMDRSAWARVRGSNTDELWAEAVFLHNARRSRVDRGIREYMAHGTGGIAFGVGGDRLFLKNDLGLVKCRVSAFCDASVVLRPFDNSMYFLLYKEAVIPPLVLPPADVPLLVLSDSD